jgi:hypothetical protein
MRRRTFSLVLITMLLPVAAGAQDAREQAPAEAPAAEGGAGRPARSLSVGRRVHDSGPRTAPLTAGLGSGYGYTEAVLGQQDRHDRLLGTLLLEGAPLSWLGLGLRLDGRYDHHGFADGPADDGWVGEPRLHARADHALTDRLSAGLRTTLFLPGAQAPSWTPGATSADLLAMITHAGQQLKVSANAGYRLDRSARSVSGGQYMPGDRLALGISDFDAVLLGAAASYDLPGWQLFGEWSWDVLVGGRAPAASRWPMRVGAGGRAALSRSMDLELMAEASPSARPAMQVGDPLVPVPPRLSVLAALILPFGVPAAAPVPSTPLVKAPGPAPLPVPTLSVSLSTGGPLPEQASVVLERPGGEQPFDPEGDGRYTLRDVTPGPATVVVRASGHEDSRTAVQLRPGQPLAVDVALVRKLPSGQIRGTVRSFQGRGIAATIQVSGAEGNGPVASELRSDGGAFQVDVPPGRYQVLIQAPGHAPQTRTVLVERNGVTVLNVDLRPER